MTPDIFFTEAPPARGTKRPTWYVHTSIQIPPEIEGTETVTKKLTPQRDEFGIVRPVKVRSAIERVMDREEIQTTT